MSEAPKPKKKRTLLWVLLAALAVLVIISIIGTAWLLISRSLSRTSYSPSSSYDYDYGLSQSSDTLSLLDKETKLSGSPSSSESSALSKLKDMTSSEPSSVSDSLTTTETTDTAAGELTEQKVIKTGSLTMTVDEADKTADKISEIADDKNGFVQSSNISTNSADAQSATVVIKVPANDFERTVRAIKELAKSVEKEYVTGQDVTEQYVDLQAQLKNYRAEEAQYVKIMEQATTVEDTLKVADKLARVRGNIESVEGKIKYLENQTDFSTITVYLSEEVSVSVPTKEWKPWTNVKTAFQAWVKTLQKLVDVSVWLVIFLGPLVVLVWILVALIRRRLKKKKQAEQI